MRLGDLLSLVKNDGRQRRRPCTFAFAKRRVEEIADATGAADALRSHARLAVATFWLRVQLVPQGPSWSKDGHEGEIIIVRLAAFISTTRKNLSFRQVLTHNFSHHR